MKKLFLFLIAAFLTLSAYTQKITPIIKTGTIVNMVIIDHDKIIPVSINIKNAGDTLNLSWKASTKAMYTSKGAALANIDQYFTQPHREGIPSQRFQNDESLINISRDMYKKFLDNNKKSLIYQGITYFPDWDKDNADFILDGKVINAKYMTSKNGQYKMWVLDYAPFPLVLQAINPLFGFSYKVVSVK